MTYQQTTENVVRMRQTGSFPIFFLVKVLQCVTIYIYMFHFILSILQKL